MKVFITGATGFIGQHLCERLINDGHQVIALVRSVTKAITLQKKGVALVEGDLSVFLDPDFKIDPCDVVIHLAGKVTAHRQREYEAINFDPVVHLYTWLLRQKWTPRRLLFASSLAATGPSGLNTPLTENSPAAPIDLYGQSKLKAETFLLHQKDFPVTVFRPCAVMGPGDTNFLNMFKLAQKGLAFLPQHHTQNISYIAVSDLIDAIITLAHDSSTQHHTYFVSHDDAVTIQTLWQQVGLSLNKTLRIIRVPWPLLYVVMQTGTAYANLFRQPIVFDRKYYEQLKAPAWVCLSHKLQKDFSWKPQKNLVTMVQETAQSYKELNWL